MQGYNCAIKPPTNKDSITHKEFLTIHCRCCGSRRNTFVRNCTRFRTNWNRVLRQMRRRGNVWCIKKYCADTHTRPRESRCRCCRKRISKSVHLRISTKVRYVSIERRIDGTIPVCDILGIFAAAPCGQSKHRARFLRVLRSRFSRKFPRTSLCIRRTLASQCRSCLTFLSLKLLWRILQLSAAGEFLRLWNCFEYFLTFTP